MYMITKTCKALPNIITKVRQGAAQQDLQGDIWICFRLKLNGSLRHFCTSQIEDKHIPYSSKNIVQTKKEQRRRYDPTLKYEALRQCAVPRFAYYDDSATDWTDSDSEIEIQTITEEEAQTQKEKILAEAKAEQPFKYKPSLNYDILKQFFYIDSPDSLAYSDLMLPSHTMEEMQPKMDIYRSETIVRQLHFIGPDFDRRTKTESKMETETKTETMAEDEAQKDNILAGTNGEQLFRYDPSIKYEPLKRYIVPRFDFFDSSATDWSDSTDSSVFSDSESESETKTMADEEAENQKGRILSGSKEKLLFHDDLVKYPSTNLRFMSEDSVNHGHGAKSSAGVRDKVLKRAKEIDLYDGVKKVTNDYQNECEESLIYGRRQT